MNPNFPLLPNIAWDELRDYVIFEGLLSDLVLYFGATVPFFLIFWVWYARDLQPRRIQQQQRSNSQQWGKEIRQSMMSIMIFTAIDTSVYIASKNGLTLVYDDISQYGIAYWVFSTILLLAFNETYFYWTHRLMHWKPIYKLTHKVHHDSIDTSPFTAFSFHPIEAIIENLPDLICAFLFPLHMSALFAYQLASIVMNVIAHLGYEIIPQSWTRNWIGQWKTPSTHHNMHHSKVNGNYSLYFRCWDVWMGTEFKDYPATLDTVYARTQIDRASAHSESIGN